MYIVSIFCPPLRGDETFDKDGGYTASGPIEPTDRRMFVKRVDEKTRAKTSINELLRSGE